MNRNGHIKLHRKMLDWEWFKHPPTVVTWLTILMLAEWNTDNGLKPGQLMTTSKELEEITGLSRQQIRTALDHLVATKNITKKLTKNATKNGMLITVENWRIYQHKPPKTNQESNQETNQDINQSSYYIKNNKEDKEEKKWQPAPVEAVPMPQDLKEKLSHMFSMN